MAWYMELTEWVNTLERFKNWKQRKGKALEIQLDELADVLAFGLSAFLQCENLNKSHIVENVQEAEERLTGHKDYGLDFLESAIESIKNDSEWVYIAVYVPFAIAVDLYSIDQLLDAYEKKMKVNHDRQDNGY